MHYDPMIAKLIVWDRDRASALQRLAGALDECAVVGIRSNVGFLRAIATHPAFAAADLETGFIAKHADLLTAPAGSAPSTVLAAAVRAVIAEARPANPGDPFSPWNTGSAWRPGGGGYRTVFLRDGTETIAVRAVNLPSGRVRLDLPDGPAEIGPSRPSDTDATIWIDGVKSTVRVRRHGDEITVIACGRSHVFQVVDPLSPKGTAADAGGQLTAPMPARIISVNVEAGQVVERGAVLVVLEAMKTQMRVTAPAHGTVTAVHCVVDDQVDDGATLVSFETAAG